MFDLKWKNEVVNALNNHTEHLSSHAEAIIELQQMVQQMKKQVQDGFDLIAARIRELEKPHQKY